MIFESSEEKFLWSAPWWHNGVIILVMYKMRSETLNGITQVYYEVFPKLLCFITLWLHIAVSVPWWAGAFTDSIIIGFSSGFCHEFSGIGEKLIWMTDIAFCFTQTNKQQQKRQHYCITSLLILYPKKTLE